MIMSIFSLTLFLISLILMIISTILSKKTTLDREKSSPFECGFDAISSSRIPFSLRFFLIAVIFLIFDVEIALVMPIMSTFFLSNTKIWMTTSFLIMIILIWGLYHEWNMNSLDWKLF
uniref:NADH-ubiquinone oxidoreductase chain 3 n=1 Tax=Holarthrothrips indicus TaxID=1965675 RepID=A0A8A5L665_9NEOP|nr:NADH dehydrogenase subunit 3 [Holarthrothrips indicus]